MKGVLNKPYAPYFGVKRGDVWQMGKHRLMCGDAQDARDVADLRRGIAVHLVFTSPPYGHQRQYKTPAPNWRLLMHNVFSNLPVDPYAQVAVNLGIHHELGEWSLAWVDWVLDMGMMGYKRAAWLVWNKGDGMPILPNLCRPNPAHEFVFLFRKQKREMQRCVPCKWHGKDTLRKPGLKNKAGKAVAVTTHVGKPIQAFKVTDSVITLSPEKHNRTGHPAVYPVGLPAHMFRAFTQPNEYVYDPFAGTATSLIAAEQTRRIGYGMEIAPEYVEMALARWCKAYPDQPPALIANNVSESVV